MQRCSPKVGSLPNALRCSGTTVPGILRRVEFWLFFGVHMAVWVLRRLGTLPDAWEGLESEHMQAVTMLAVLLQVFYAGQCYVRHIELRSLVRSMIGTVHDFAFSARMHLRPAKQPYDRLASRWLALLLLLFLLEARGGSKLQPAEWENLLKLGVARKDEADFLRRLSGQQRLLVMLHMTSELVRMGLVENGAHPVVQAQINGILMEYRSLQQEAEGILARPVLFRYAHLLSLAAVVNLLIWAYAAALTAGWLGPPLYLAASLPSTALAELTARLAAPAVTAGPALTAWAEDLLQGTAALLDREHSGAKERFRSALAKEPRSSSVLKEVDLGEMADLLGIAGVAAPPAGPAVSGGTPTASSASSPRSAVDEGYSLLPKAPPKRVRPQRKYTAMVTQR